MKLLCGSDFHGTVPKNIKKVVEQERPDAFLYAGDMAPHPGEGGSSEEVVEGLAGLGIPVYAVAGNVESPHTLMLAEKSYPNFKLIGMKKVELNGYNIIGFSDFSVPLVFLFKNLMSDMFESVIKGCDPQKTIVLNHVPPQNTKTDFATAWGFEEHAGDESLRKVIEKFQPLLVVCGHIHEAKGTDKIGKTLVLNTATTLSIVEIEDGKKPQIRFVG